MDIGYSIILCLGIIIGYTIKKIKYDKQTLTGTIKIDHNSGLCKFSITSDELSNPKCKKVIFQIEHDAIITDDEYLNNSQEKQGL